MNWKKLFLFLLFVLFVVGLSKALRHGVDFPVYKKAALLLLEGETEKIYNAAETGPFFYPLVFAGAFIPLAVLPDGLAKGVLFCFLFFSISILLFLTHRRFKKGLNDQKSFLLLSLILIITLNASTSGFHNLNLGLLMAGLSFWAFDMRVKHPFLCSLILSIAIAAKLYPLVVLCFFVWEHRWKLFINTTLLSLILIFGFPILLHGWEGGVYLIHAQYSTLGKYNSIWGWDSRIFQNFPATFLRYFGPFMGNADSTVKFIITVVSGFVILPYLPSLIKGGVKEDNIDSEYKFCFVFAMIPLVLPISWQDMVVFLVPCLYILMKTWVVEKNKWALSGPLVYFVFYGLTRKDLIGKVYSEFLELWSIPFWSLFYVVILFFALNFRQKQNIQIKAC